MYTNASNELNQMIENVNNNSLKARIVFADGSTIDKINKLVFYGGSNKSDAIQIGSTTMAYIELSIETDRLLTNEEVTLECGAKLTDGTEEYIPIGKFTFQKPVGDIDGVEVVANDRMQRFERVYSSSLTYPTTSAEVLNELCTICGVTLATPIENPIEITDKLDGYTCREVLGFISALHGKFACIDRFGELNVRWYSDSPITKETRVIWSFTKAEHNTTIDKVEIHKNTEVSYTSGSGFNVLFNSNPYATQESTDNVFNSINGFTYNASKIELVDDIRLDCWDVINVPYLDGNEYLVPCMALTQDFSNGSTIIQAFSKSEVENEYNYTGAISNYIERVAYELLLANRVIATKVDAEYVNSHAITTENFEAKIAEITTLVVEQIDGRYATIDFANIDIANINKANIGLLFAEVGLLDRATIVDGHVTGFLDAVEINANKITAGTLMVDRLIFRGAENSIIYQLNNITSKNLVPYPYAETTHIDNGIEWTDLGNGRVKANGLASNASAMLISDNITLEPGEYTLSGCPSGGSTSKYRLQLSTADYSKNFNELGNGLTFTLTETTTFAYFRAYINSGTEVTDIIFEPMLCKGTEVLPFEPFRERTQALTSETVNGEVLTDRTITADKIIAKSITSNEIDVAQLFADEAAIRTLVAQSIFTDAIETNRVVVGASDTANEALDKVKKTVKSITMHYLATDIASGVTTSTSGWTTTVQQIDATKKYLWTYQTMTYADGTTTDTTPVISGVYGNEGVDGRPGENGIGVISVIPLYYLKSNTTAPSAPTAEVTTLSTGSGVWTQSIPFYVSGYTYFTCTQTKYTDGTFTWSEVVADNSLTEAYASLENKANRDEVVADNLIPFPYTDSSKASAGITWTAKENGYIVGTGIATGDSSFYLSQNLVLPAGTYTLSGCPSNGSSSTYRLQLATANYSLNLNDYGSGATFTLTEETTFTMFRIFARSGVDASSLIFKPMLEKGDKAHPYTEYKKGGTGIANNLYYQSTTLIDGNKIYTGTVTADKIDVNGLFAKDINVTGTFTATNSAWIRPSWEDTVFIRDYYFGTSSVTLTEQQKKSYDFNKNGDIDLQDVTICKMFATVPEKTLQEVVDDYGYEPINSNVKVVIDPSNPDKVIQLTATNSFGRDVDIYFGTLGIDVPMVNTNSISCANINAKSTIQCEDDVYANYGLDTEISLLGLKEKVDYLQPHGYSLIRYTDIGELSTTQKVYTLFNGRKMSDYGMLLITVGVGATDIRETMYVPTLVFSGSDALPRTLYLECWTDGGTTFNQVQIDYVSDTQIKAFLVTSTTKTKYLNIYGVKVDAALSGRSVDGYF